MAKPLNNYEFLSMLADGVVGNPPNSRWWRTTGPGDSEPPLSPEIYQQASNLRLFFLATRSGTAELYPCSGLSRDDVKLRLGSRFEDDIWEACQKLCPQEALEEYYKHYKFLPDFPEYDQDIDDPEPA